jgi:hypothetical protein
VKGLLSKTLVGNRQTRDHHKQRNSWVVIDIAKAREAVERARRDPKNAAIADHEGKLLDACRQDCVVARLDGAYTEYSARLFASNGGFAKYRQARMLGQAISRKYLDDLRKYLRKKSGAQQAHQSIDRDGENGYF